MFIQTEATPNPATMKFLPGREVLGAKGTAFYTDIESAKHSPLAQELFAADGVAAVFLGRDFVTVTKKHDMEWEVLRPMVLTSLVDFFTTGRPVYEEAKKEVAKSEIASDDPVVQQIVELIDTRVRPAVAMDGGDILFHSFEDGVVKLQMHGACSGCPSSTATLKMGIENMLKHYIPEVVAVEQV